MTTYIYSLSDPRTNEVRYIGKSEHPKRRLFCHMTHARTGRDPTKKGRWLRGLDKIGLYPALTILAECDGDGSTEECEHIARGLAHGLKLLNMTPGGDGIPKTPEMRAKQSRTMKQKYANDPVFRRLVQLSREKATAKVRGAKQNAEHIRRRTSGMKGRVFSEATKTKMSIAACLPHRLEWSKNNVKKLHAALRGKKVPPEIVLKRMRGLWGPNWIPKPKPLFVCTEMAGYVKAPQSRCGYRGVGFHKRSGKWRVYLMHRHLGLYPTAIQAALAYDAAAAELYGERAVLNFNVTLNVYV